jgi:Fe2+ or Zn2+ uptake regulation protein
LSSYRPEILAAFKQRGLRCTPQRYGVLECLLRRPVHATAEEIYRAMNRADPRVSRATVYNNLRTLIEAGLVREMQTGGKAARFDARIQPHHHFLCERCGRLEDIEWFDLRMNGATTLGKRRLSGYDVILRGTCEGCI